MNIRETRELVNCSDRAAEVMSRYFDRKEINVRERDVRGHLDMLFFVLAVMKWIVVITAIGSLATSGGVSKAMLWLGGGLTLVLAGVCIVEGHCFEYYRFHRMLQKTLGYSFVNTHVRLFNWDLAADFLKDEATRRLKSLAKDILEEERERPNGRKILTLRRKFGRLIKLFAEFEITLDGIKWDSYFPQKG